MHCMLAHTVVTLHALLAGKRQYLELLNLGRTAKQRAKSVEVRIAQRVHDIEED